MVWNGKTIKISSVALSSRQPSIVSHLIAGTDVHSSFQIFQNFVDVSCPCRSQETCVAVRLEETQTKKNTV